jgi:hypothetical protein
VSLLKNIWRPNESPQGQKRPGAPGESVLTERLAELLGRDLEPEQDPTSPTGQDQATSTATESPENASSAAAAETSVETSKEEASAAEPTPRPPKRPAAPGSTTGVGSISRATEEALERLKAAESQMEIELRNRLDDYGRAFEAALGGMDREPSSERPLEEAAEQFRSEAREWFNEARRELRDQLEASRTSLKAELKNSHNELIESARQKIEGMARSSAEASQGSRDSGREQIEQWLKEQGEASRRQAESAAQNLAQATEQALERLRATEERIEKSFRGQVEDYRRAVESAVADLERKGISQAKFQHAAEELQQVTEQILERSTRHIEERTAQAMSSLGEKVEEAQRSLAGAARQSLETALAEQRERWANAWQEQSRAAREAVAEEAAHGKSQLEAARQAVEAEFRKAADEQALRLAENAAAELRGDKFRAAIVAETSAEMERVAREVIGRSTGQLKETNASALANLSEAFQKTSQNFLTETQQRLEAAGKTWFETAAQTLQEEYRTRISAWLEEQTTAARQQTEAAGKSMAEMAEAAGTRLEAIARETEAAFLKRADEQQKRWVEAALEQAHKQGFDRKVIEQALSELGANANRFLEESKKQMAEQAAASRRAISGEMDEAARKLLDGVEASLEKISWDHRGRLAQWWEERTQTARREAEAAGESVARAAQQAASQLRLVQTEIETELKSRSREQQLQLLDSAMEEMRRSGAIDRVATEASGTLRNTANDILSRSAEQLREHVETSRLALDNQAQASRRGLAEELARKVEQAQSSVESAGKAVTEDYRRQLSVWWEERTQSARRESEEATSGISRAARMASEQLQSLRKEMENELQSGLQNYRKGLREAAAEELRRQGFQKDLLDTITVEIEKTTKDLSTRSSQELRQQVESALSGVNDKFKDSRQSYIDETQKQLAELTRTSLDMATSRYHEFLTKSVQELEYEQEEWLQRKRESIWMDINNQRAGAAPTSGSGSRQNMPFQQLQEGSGRSGSVVGKVFGVLAVFAMAAVLTAGFVKFAPRKAFSMQLQTNPPAGFVDQRANWTPQHRARELQMAQAYWMIGINILQHKYLFNSDLPATAPPDFKVDQNGLKDDAAIRDHYWQKMREIWKTPEDWQKVEVSNGNGLSRAIGWLQSTLFAQADKPPEKK